MDRTDASTVMFSKASTLSLPNALSLPNVRENAHLWIDDQIGWPDRQYTMWPLKLDSDSSLGLIVLDNQALPSVELRLARQAHDLDLHMSGLKCGARRARVWGWRVVACGGYVGGGGWCWMGVVRV